MHRGSKKKKKTKKTKKKRFTYCLSRDFLLLFRVVSNFFRVAYLVWMRAWPSSYGMWLQLTRYAHTTRDRACR